MFKRVLIATVALVASAAWATEVPKLTGPVVDNAKVLSATDASALSAKLKAVESLPDKPQVVFLTVPKLPEEGIDVYANDVYRAWGLGQKGKDNGVLLVLAPNDRKIRIEVAYGLETAIPDSVANQIIQNMKPDMKAKNWNKALVLAADQIIQRIPKESVEPAKPATVAAPVAAVDKVVTEKKDPPAPTSFKAFFLTLILLSGALTGVWYVFVRRENRRKSTSKFEEALAKSRTYTNTSQSTTYTGSTKTYTKPTPRPSYNNPTPPRRTYKEDHFTDGLTTGLILGSLNKHDDSNNDRYRKSSKSSDSDSRSSSSWSGSSDSGWSSSSSSSSSSDSWSSSSDSYSGGGGDSGGGGSSDSW